VHHNVKYDGIDDKLFIVDAVVVVVPTENLSEAAKLFQKEDNYYITTNNCCCSQLTWLALVINTAIILLFKS